MIINLVLGMLAMHYKYARYIFRHKWCVFRAGLFPPRPCQRVGFWRLVFHDWSKFKPGQWLGYARFFYGPHTLVVASSPAQARVRAPEDVARAFDVAWLEHQNIHPHHWQYWVLLKDDGSQVALEMPDVYRREMLADWRGAGAALGNPDTRAWYEKNAERMKLHYKTEYWVGQQLGIYPPDEYWTSGPRFA